jgi:hypothetical protein
LDNVPPSAAYPCMHPHFLPRPPWQFLNSGASTRNANQVIPHSPFTTHQWLPFAFKVKTKWLCRLTGCLCVPASLR